MEIDYESLPEVTMVQLPCYCDNKTKVESFLGGKELLEQTILEENMHIKFAWDPSDSLRPSLKGKRIPKQGILLSLKKFKSGAVVSKALGRVTHSYSFDSPPDYQFLGMNQLSGGGSSLIVGKNLETVPYPFLKNENPLDYQYLYSIDSNRMGERIRNRPTAPTVQQIRYGDPIPCFPYGQDEYSIESDFSLIKMPPSSQTHHTTFTTINFVKYYLHSMFSLRPCWSKKQLMETLISYFEWFHSSPQEKLSFHDLIHTLAANLKNLLPHVAYLSTSGPWRNLYIKYRYNPSEPTSPLSLSASGSDSSSTPPPPLALVPSIFQTITLKLSSQEYNRLLQRYPITLLTPPSVHLTDLYPPLPFPFPIRLQPFYQEGQEFVNLDTLSVQPLASLSNGLNLTVDPTTRRHLQLLCFDVPIRTQFMVQICSLRDPDFLKYFESLSQSHSLIDATVAKDQITRSDPNSTFVTAPEDGSAAATVNQTQAVGWFYETEYEVMRKLVKRIISRRIDEFILRQQQILSLSSSSSQNGETLRVAKPKHTTFEDRLMREKAATHPIHHGSLLEGDQEVEEEEEESKALEVFLEQSRDLLWVNLYRKACESFTYPKCPQLQTSQGLVNIANRKRALPNSGVGDSCPSENRPERVKKTRREREGRHRHRTGSSGTRTRTGTGVSDSAEKEREDESPQRPMKNKALEDLWVEAESFAIFDEEENETEDSDEGEEDEDDESGVEENDEIIVSEWI